MTTSPLPMFTLRSANPAKARGDVLVVGVQQSPKGPALAAGAEDVAQAFGRKLRPLLTTLGVTGKAGEVTKLPSAGAVSAPLLVLVGLGPELDHDAVRRGVGAAARAVSAGSSVVLALPADSAALVRAVTEGYALGRYAFTAYQSTAKETTDTPAEVTVLSPAARNKDVIAAFADAQLLIRAITTTRDWVNTPAGDLRPPDFAEAVVADAKRWAKLGSATKVRVKVYDEVALAELGCGGILGVGAASSAPPRLVELSYAPRGATTHLALVGKGITFDSGGLTIKPGQGMGDMKGDMAGAAAVIQATFAIAALGLPVKVSTFAPMAENMISGTATRPGDILRMYGGKTVEVTNTDCEGRLILGDALVRATEQRPDIILDVATLTGAMVVALGDKVAGVLGTAEVVQQVMSASRTAGEPHWPMPIPEEMAERVASSKVADLTQHDWVRWGSGLFAAAFLREFTDGLPWAHLDIAGPAFNTGGASGHLTSGGTGFAVATLVDFARNLA